MSLWLRCQDRRMGLEPERNANLLCLVPGGYLFVYLFSWSAPSRSLERAKRAFQTLSISSIPLWQLQRPTVIQQSH